MASSDAPRVLDRSLQRVLACSHALESFPAVASRRPQVLFTKRLRNYLSNLSSFTPCFLLGRAARFAFQKDFGFGCSKLRKNALVINWPELNLGLIFRTRQYSILRLFVWL